MSGGIGLPAHTLQLQGWLGWQLALLHYLHFRIFQCSACCCKHTQYSVDLLAWWWVQALKAIHALGVAHGDIRPDNILVEQQGVDEPKVRCVMLIMAVGAVHGG